MKVKLNYLWYEKDKRCKADIEPQQCIYSMLSEAREEKVRVRVYFVCEKHVGNVKMLKSC